MYLNFNITKSIVMLDNLALFPMRLSLLYCTTPAKLPATFSKKLDRSKSGAPSIESHNLEKNN